MKLDSKTIVLTGGSSGVGFELLRRLAQRSQVISLSRSEPDWYALPEDAQVTHISTDLSDPASLASAIAEVQALARQGIDGLINCAAVQFTPRFTDEAFDAASISREIAINLTAPLELVAGLLGWLGRRPESFILNVNSGLALVPKSESAVYCATKAGLDNFSRGLRAQLSGSSVRVLQAFLPLVDTPMTEGRGTGKLSPGAAARRIIEGVERGVVDNDIGKVGLLRAIARLSPSLASRIIQGGRA